MEHEFHYGINLFIMHALFSLPVTIISVATAMAIINRAIFELSLKEN